MSYVYVKSEEELWTVGFYDPAGKWIPESDHGNRDSAAHRVAWLNGSVGTRLPRRTRSMDAPLRPRSVNSPEFFCPTCHLRYEFCRGHP